VMGNDKGYGNIYVAIYIYTYNYTYIYIYDFRRFWMCLKVGVSRPPKLQMLLGKMTIQQWIQG
jgi:hypothetical protein